MEVTKSNFTRIFPLVSEAIKHSDFVAIDCELTGLYNGYDVNGFDTQKEYYEKLIQSSKKFLVIQFGLCLFRYDVDEKVFKQQAYNFYVFPHAVNKLTPDHRFLCQASSIDFLANQGFDFNKLFKEGISYLNDTEKIKYEDCLKVKRELRANQSKKSSPQIDRGNIVAMSDEDKVQVDGIFKEIDKFLIMDDNEMILPKCNAYIRRLIYQESPRRLGGKVSLETREENKDRVLVVCKPKSEEENQEHERKLREKEQNQMRDSIGFSEVLRELAKSGKLIVGHNMVLDLLHTIDKFLTPLPDDYEDFKNCAHSYFSNVIDTKFLSTSEPFKDKIDSSILIHLLNSLQKEPFGFPPIEIEEGREGYSLEVMKEHEAGFDAFITGMCFLGMWKYLENLNDIPDSELFHDFSSLDDYKNKLVLMRLHDNPCITLGGPDIVPSRDHVLYITFPKTWKLNDLIQLFSPFGKIFVSWIDDRSAYVGLQRKDQIVLALKTLSQNDSFSVMSYAKRKAELNKRSIPTTASPHPFKMKKSLFQPPKVVAAKRRASNSGESTLSKKKKSIEPIIEESEDNGEFKVARSLSNTFQESSSWD